MSAPQLLDNLKDLGIVVASDGARLHVDAPAGVLTPELTTMLIEHKAELLALLAAERCALPVCLHPVVMVYDGDGLPYCAQDAPPTTACPDCSGTTWRRSVWGGWRCRTCTPEMGKTRV